MAVLGITQSSQADLIGRIDRLGTNLLTVLNGRSVDGDEAQLPLNAASMVNQTDGVLASAPTAELDAVQVHRSDRIPAYGSGGLSVRACDDTLLSTLDGQVSQWRVHQRSLEPLPGDRPAPAPLTASCPVTFQVLAYFP